MSTYQFPTGSPTPEPSSPISQIVNAARAGICELYRNHPDYLASNANGGNSLRRGILSSFCSPYPNGLPPPPQPPYAGGQCKTLYQFAVTWNRNAPFDQPPVTTFSEAYGAIGGLRFNSALSAIQVLAYPTPSGTPQQWINVATGENLGVNNLTFDYIVRADGQLDNCGDPPPDYEPTAPPTTPELNVNVNVTLAPNFSVNVNAPISLNWNSNSTSFNFSLNPDIDLDVDLGGVSISFGNQGGGGGGGGTIGDVNNTVNQIQNTVNNVNNTVNNINGTLFDVKNIVDAIEPCDLSPVLAAIAEFRGITIENFEQLDDTLEYIIELIQLLLPKTCESMGAPTVIQSGTFNTTGEVKYIDIPEGCEMVYLYVSDYDNRNVRAYKLADDGLYSEFGFGNISIGYEGINGFIGSSSIRWDVWNRLTSYHIDKGCPTPTKVRLSLKRGVQYQLIDANYREVMAELPPR